MDRDRGLATTDMNLRSMNSEKGMKVLQCVCCLHYELRSDVDVSFQMGSGLTEITTDTTSSPGADPNLSTANEDELAITTHDHDHNDGFMQLKAEEKSQMEPEQVRRFPSFCERLKAMYVLL